MKTKKAIQWELKGLHNELEYISKNIPAGTCHWRICKAKIETLQWVIGEI